MDKILLYPPIAFVAVFIFVSLLAKLFSGLAVRRDKKAEGTEKSYACGEDVQDHLSQPDYSQFFPFAFFFTIAHVATLILTTVPVQTRSSLVLAVLYIIVVMMGLRILFRRER